MGKNINRRGFFKASLLGAAAAAVASATVAQETMSPLVAEAANIVAPVKELSEFPYQVTDQYRRFPGNKIYWMRIFDTEDNKTPIKFLKDDVSEITGKKDTGKDLPLINAEYLGIKGRRATLSETGISYWTQNGGFLEGHRSNLVGWTRLEEALSEGGWSIELDYNGLTSPGNGPGGLNCQYPIDPKTNEKAKEPVWVPGLFNWDNSVAAMRRQMGQQYKFQSTEEASKVVKKATRFYGASLVGIAPYDDRWTYSNWARTRYQATKDVNGVTSYSSFNVQKFMTNKEVEVYGLDVFEADWEKYAGFTPKNVIIFAIEMDYEAARTSPSLISDAAVGKGYSRMGEIAYKVATFIRNLGYNAIPSGNDTGLSVPIAVQAGLGEAARHGMLITQKYGPRLRLAKVYTDLDLTPDKPISIGVREFCRLCKKCADACPSQAISHEKEARIQTPEESGDSIAAYTEKWQVDPGRCLSWMGYNAGCSNCIAVCSWNKIKQWNHDVARIATQIPLVQDAARKFDEWFGYGGPVNAEERIESGYCTNLVKDFWNNLDPIN
ncbi:MULTISPECIES: reductive dehalogenase [unclassified Dehalobacter]|uniref:reductive dehalogenase n=1 Tax=unclassified Dehalobacter TaxID=2635733 RepID=UPI000E6BE5E3|nr:MULTISPECIES: reductive dehalogenase [unclassified Dehalobacter]RJE48650.1 tetrachloroethene dehalogenase [Dehalobacter sp. MCB1]TCX47268.1 reductive dehalogenase [Dehalobacter sp. 14DCB1]TCX55690.1 reductive dehalogenase [Dehalobacter sp. 12DCB1]